VDRPLLRRILLSAFLFDGSFYVVGTVVPLAAVALGASAFELGLMPVLGSGSYVLAALLGGHLADCWPRLTMARIGAVLRAGVTLLLLTAHSTGHLLAVLPLFGLVNGLFWPGIQAALPGLAGPRELAGLIGRFNVSWSAGKMLGFALGGILVDRLGYGVPICIAAFAGGVPAVILPRDRINVARGLSSPERDGEVGGGRSIELDGSTPTGSTRAVPTPAGSTSAGSRPGAMTAATWRRIGWTSNFLLFGVGATLNYHYPKLLDALGFGGTEFGIFLGIVYLVQTAAFLLFGRWGGWHYRASWLLGAQGLVAGALLILPVLREAWAIWSLAPAIGLGLGMAYSSSLFYSLLGPGGHGRSTGLHEAILASGSFLLPFLGGLAVRASGNLLLPYLLAATVVVLGIFLQGAWLRGLRRRQQLT